MPRNDTPSPAPARTRGRQGDVLAAIALGGGLGSIARYGLSRAWPTPAGGFPVATFVTNLAGCALLGLLMVYVLEVWPPSRYRRPFLGVGFIGGFTTFSTYEVELRGLLAEGRFSLADAYALSSLVLGLAAVWTGMVLGRRVARLPVRRGPVRRGGPQAAPPAVQPEPDRAQAASPEGRSR